MDTKEAAQHLGKLGGMSRSKKKQDSSRANGRRGGRPAVGVTQPAPETEQSTMPQVHVFTTTTAKES
jgi:hypothetical protein